MRTKCLGVGSARVERFAGELVLPSHGSELALSYTTGHAAGVHRRDLGSAHAARELVLVCCAVSVAVLGAVVLASGAAQARKTSSKSVSPAQIAVAQAAGIVEGAPCAPIGATGVSAGTSKVMTCKYKPFSKLKDLVWIDDPFVPPSTSLAGRNPPTNVVEPTTTAIDPGIIRHLGGPAELTAIVTEGHSCKAAHLGFVAHSKDGVLFTCKANPGGTPVDTWQAAADAGNAPAGQLHQNPTPMFPLKVQEGHPCSVEHLGWTAYTKQGVELKCRPKPLARTPARAWQL